MGATSPISEAAIPVHVLHVISELNPGGMEFGVVKLVNGLNPRRIRSTICSTRPAGDNMKRLVSSDVRVIELRRRDGNDPRLVWELFRVFRRERPNIVHTHAWGTLLEGLIAARLARVPVVIHGEHGTLQLQPRQRVVQRHAWGRVDRLLSVSSRLSERMAREIDFPIDRITTIRNGVDLSRFGRITRDDARAALGVPQDAIVVGTVGRLVPVKDQAGLLEAVATLRTQGPQPTVLIAGEGPLRDTLASRITALGLQDHVRLLGHRPDVERVLAALDLFVLSSSSEGLSNTILEAMATGLPVVATAVGGADELVADGESGLLVPPRDPAALAAALGHMLRSPETLVAFGRAGRARVESMFDLAATIQRYEDLYREALAYRRRRPEEGVSAQPIA